MGRSAVIMKTVLKDVRIIAYGARFAKLTNVELREAARGVSISNRWGPRATRSKDTSEYLLVSSAELDQSFTDAFRERATPATRLLVIRDEGGAADRLLSRFVELQIRTPQRFCVVEATRGTGKTHSAAILRALLRRLASGVETDHDDERILDATIEEAILHVVSTNFDRLDIPIGQIPELKNQDPAKAQAFEIDEDGSFIYWRELDLHLGWLQLQQLADPEAALKARQKSEGFNKRYGKAVRRIRERAGLAPRVLSGLSEKQLRRIEKGQCRLTSHAIAVLSKAHNLEPNEYMKKLAESLE
jgi:hypothetical protein